MIADSEITPVTMGTMGQRKARLRDVIYTLEQAGLTGRLKSVASLNPD